MALEWPVETVLPRQGGERWCEPASNRVMDFHGDPFRAQLVVFSDGNHHMALLPAMKAFYEANPAVADIFYATTPPGPIVAMLRSGALKIGNLVLSVAPHVFISPPRVMATLQADGWVRSHHLLARNQGSVLLVRKADPADVSGVRDLMRREVRLFISNPETETVSYRGYRRTLEALAADQGIAADAFARAVFGDTVVWGRRIHHREAPEALAAGRADVAIVYYHLALRYTRIFPDRFDFVPLGGTRTHPAPPPQNRTAAIHMGLVGQGGAWGERFLEFMRSPTVADIYTRHGMRPHGSDGADSPEK
ncbi:hypothetical protein DSCA_48780 [Desulfosarcina alkanivorans]|uniref:ABC transporter substrate-binding protein n=1 Tax=Desulfosarcina alkanivorans TaxID=571177 RepID=A0A5K7YQF0_9BACT|nr:substrate-binding domain-containing protein [Desulfosarcina alkanivorans]BBO70948.1 hypothetical protein DSCA_48780 [Desulfosarcina alkanivorans]